MTAACVGLPMRSRGKWRVASGEWRVASEANDARRFVAPYLPAAFRQPGACGTPEALAVVDDDGVRGVELWRGVAWEGGKEEGRKRGRACETVCFWAACAVLRCGGVCAAVHTADMTACSSSPPARSQYAKGVPSARSTARVTAWRGAWQTTRECVTCSV